MKSFRIKRFKMWGLKQFEQFENVELELSDPTDVDSGYPYTTLVIGANATGKSRLLRVLVEVFNDLYKYHSEDNSNFSFKGGYNLEYIINEATFIIENSRQELLITRNGKKILIDKLELPNQIIAASYSITDRFPQQASSFSTRSANPYRSPIIGRYDKGIYTYLGVRTFNNMASATGHITRTIDLLITSYINGHYNPLLIEVFNTLKLVPRLSIEYRFKSYSSLIGQEKLSENNLQTFIQSLDEKKAGFSYKYFQELLKSPDQQKALIQYADVIRERSKSVNRRKTAPLIFDLDFTNSSTIEQFISEYKMLDLLRKLNLVGYGEVLVFRKDNKRFDINKGSSGEINLFTSLISLACIIENNSLILIDEPEISLHPNWQMKYLDLINTIFHSGYTNCHFIICSHSHFLVSDLRPDSSFILALKNDENMDLIANPIPRSTFGWSAEQILLEVFNVPTTRNLYVADLLGNILNMIANPERNEKNIQKEISKLFEYNLDKLDKSDPLKSVINKLIKKYGKK